MEALLKWVTHMESLLATEKFKVNEAEVMEEQLKQFKVLIDPPIWISNFCCESSVS